uniref:Uncharacterized protein n=1 Tax=Rhizophora mucronata TaxID=61149 RepID=A0A2P2PKP4_RHIMU
MFILYHLTIHAPVSTQQTCYMHNWCFLVLPILLINFGRIINSQWN